MKNIFGLYDLKEYPKSIEMASKVNLAYLKGQFGMPQSSVWLVQKINLGDSKDLFCWPQKLICLASENIDLTRREGHYLDPKGIV